MTSRPAAVGALRRRTALVILLGLIAALAATAGRMAHLQRTQAPRLEQIAERQQAGSQRLPARRGSIFDAQGRLLAGTRQMADVFVDPVRLAQLLDESFPDPATRDTAFVQFISQTALRLDLPPAQLLERVRSRPASRYLVLKTRLDEQESAAISSFRHELRDALGLTPTAVRAYPLGTSMAHVLGFVGRDGHGLEGIEKSCDAHLRGTDGVRRLVCTVSRSPLDVAPDEARDPVDGGHLVLTLDAEIQRLVETEIQQAVKQFEAVSGVGLVMDPRNGDVLALACFPTYDPNQPHEYAVDSRRNRALTDPVEPGSCFKPFVAAPALQEGFVSLRETINCHDGLHFFRGRRVRDTHPYGALDLKGIIVHSSNIGMGTIADRIPPQAMERILRGFGFGQKTGLELPGESAGILKPVKEWSGYSTISLSFGQELAVTPMQLLAALSAMVNGGSLLAPRLVRGRLAGDGSIADWHEEPQVVRRVLRTDIADHFARKILPAVVDEVSEGNLKSKKYTTLGKTGTAQVPYSNRPGYEPGAYVGSFLGAGPVSDPRLTCLVMIRKPNADKGYYGRTVAGPAVKAILEQSLEYLGVPADRPNAASMAAAN